MGLEFKPISCARYIHWWNKKNDLVLKVQNKLIFKKV